jgi:hypothetical protein
MRHVVFVWAVIIYIHVGEHGDAPRGICLGLYYVYSRWKARYAPRGIYLVGLLYIYTLEGMVICHVVLCHFLGFYNQAF